jgi:hypothetical protein
MLRANRMNARKSQGSKAFFTPTLPLDDSDGRSIFLPDSVFFGHFISVQRELGIYGGPVGSNILALLPDLPMPGVTTFHPLLREPDNSMSIKDPLINGGFYHTPISNQLIVR